MSDIICRRVRRHINYLMIPFTQPTLGKSVSSGVACGTLGTGCSERAVAILARRNNVNAAVAGALNVKPKYNHAILNPIALVDAESDYA